MTQVLRAKAIIDALAGYSVTNAKAITVVQRYTNNYTADNEELAASFNLHILNHIRHKMRDNAKKRAEQDAITNIEQETQDGYDELDYTP